MSFKLIAIRPLTGCNPKFLKNLKENQIYKFYNDYDFLDSNDKKITCTENFVEVSKIEYNPTVPEELYNQGNTKINISAIVGKNGSGKSALVELLVAAITKMSLEIDENFINPENLYQHSNKAILKELISKFETSRDEDLKNIHVEIYFYNNTFNTIPIDEIKNRIRKIKIKNNTITIVDFKNDSNLKKYTKVNKDYTINKQDKKDTNLSNENLYFLKDFFYTMIINYSHYAFNTRETGEWLKGIFHKNDGYQLPIVINPFRNEGDIDINSEKYLASSRFLVNILQEKKLREISENKTVSHISIEIDWEKLYDWDEKEKRDKRLDITEQKKEEILQNIFAVFYKEENLKFEKGNFFYPFIRDYIILKLVKIRKYSVYKDFGDYFENDYIKALENDYSHTTDKLRQALFFLRYPYLNEEDIFVEKENENLIEIDVLYKKINEAYKENQNFDLQLPKENFSIRESLPSIFKVNYYFEKEVSDNNFNSFSSGEKQKIFSIHSVIYHLRNLKSVKSYHDRETENKNKHILNENDGIQLITYKNINIIFDEIELYAHPEYQRKFLNDFLSAVNAVNKDGKEYYNLNILFITHSPFILSDIPKQNVLFLAEGKPTEDFSNKNTFGANITDLLADSFFFSEEDGNKILMGDFAKNKINETIEWINQEKLEKEKKSQEKYSPNEKDLEKHKQIIDLIDEPLLSNKLKEMYYEIFEEEKIKEQELKYLEELAKKYNKEFK